MDTLRIHERIHERHPELTEPDVRHAWINAVASTRRDAADRDEFVALGFDGKGRLLEMVAVRSPEGCWLIYHAMTPPSKKTLKELGGAL